MAGMIAHVWETAVTPPAETANMRRLVLSLLSDHTKTAAQLAHEACDALEAIAAGFPRTLFLRHLGEQRSGLADLHSRSLLDFLALGAPTGWRDFMREFWQVFKERDVRPTRIVVENEKGYTWYRLGDDAVTRAGLIQAARNAGHSKKFPRAFAAFSQAQLAGFVNAQSQPDIAAGIMLWDQTVEAMWRTALRETVLGTYATIIGEEPPPSSNYDDIRTRTTFMDSGMFVKQPYSSLMGSDSSPALWEDPNERRYNGFGTDAEKMFAATKGQFEKVRAVRGPLVPWVGVPGYMGDGWDILDGTNNTWPGWRKKILTLGLHGVSEVIYLVGNTGETAEQRAYANETFAMAAVSKPNANHRWAKPAIDTESLLTGTAGWTETAFAYNANDWT